MCSIYFERPLGAPPAADAAQLVIAMSGEVRAKRDIAYLMVPYVGRKVVDLGNNVEKGEWLDICFCHD